MPPNRRPLQTRNKAWVRALARWLTKRRASPNGISITGVGFSILGLACYLLVNRAGGMRPAILLFGAAACVQLRLLCNIMDGLVAVEGGLKGKAGDFFNEAPDRFEDIVFLVGAGMAVGDSTLGWLAAAGAVLTAYVRALGGSLGQPQDFCGPFAKQQRMFFLTVGTLGGAFYRPILLWALWLIACGAFITAARRAVRLYRLLP
jgi:phosphatidylglycerophosphate synthase